MTRVRDFLVALAMTLVLAIPLQAQETGTVSGRVTDANFGGPLATVAVTIGDRTVISDEAGNFIVPNINVGTYDVRAIRLGFRAEVVTVTVVAGQTVTVTIAMHLAPVGLQELVVVGFGELEARDLTGVVATVPAEQFNRGRIVSTEQLIQGKVAGVQVEDSGEPGGGINIRIRGGTSVTSSNEPLIVIDGVPQPVGGGLSAGRNPLNFLNPDDVESITVLKDASSTAIYGSQGANGVIMVTTKSGQRGEGVPTEISYRGTVSGSYIVQTPNIMNAAEFRQAVTDNAPGQLDLLGSANTDWYDQIGQNAFGTDHTLTVGGGSSTGDYRFSLGYLNQAGVISDAKVERLSISAAYNQLLFDDLMRIQANLLGSRNDDRVQPGGALGGATGMAPTQPVEDETNPSGFWEWEDWLGVNNPMALIAHETQEGTTYRSTGNLTTQGFMPFDRALSVTLRLGYNATKTEQKYFAPSILQGEIETGQDGTVFRANPSETTALLDLFGNYTKRWDDHSVDATLGYSYQHFVGSYPSFFAQQLSFDFFGPDGVPAAELERTFLTSDEAKVVGFLGRVNYSYKDRYIATASVRQDGSSKFGQDNEWGTFPSAAVAWRVSEESFLESASALSDLRFRVSWGINGNSAFQSFLAYKNFFVGDPLARMQFGDEFIATLRPSAADPNLKWEQTESWNIGLDYGFWDNRLFGSFEFYDKKTKDLIFTVPVAAGTNLSNFVTTNIGDMRNRGFEFNLNSLIMDGRSGGVTWDANFNAFYNDNEITEINPFGGGEQILTGGISGGVGSTIQVFQPGSPRQAFYPLIHKLDGNGNPIYEDVNNDGTIDDQDLYEDVNGDGIVNQDDRTPYKSPAPDWIFGHTSLLAYKGFDLSFTLLAYLGNYVYNNVASQYGFYDQLRDSNSPGQLHRSVLETGFDRPQYISSAYIENAGFLRLNNIEFGYTFQSGSLSGMRLFGTIQNVFTITGYSGIDPTAGINGIDNNLFPRSRTFLAGLSVAF